MTFYLFIRTHSSDLFDYIYVQKKLLEFKFF